MARPRIGVIVLGTILRRIMNQLEAVLIDERN